MSPATAPSGTTTAQALRDGAEKLRAIGVDNPRLEARLLLAHATGRNPASLLRDLQDPVDTAGFDTLLARRLRHEPLAHLTGRREFWSLDFAVSPATLIPRPDSETVVEAALDLLPGRDRAWRLLDLGTGSGCLLLALLHERPCAFGVGVDIVPAAAALAARNAAALGLRARAAFLCGSWAEALAGPFDLVVSNPPYIPSGSIAALMPEVAEHEPRTALDGGADGLDAYRRTLADLSRMLSPGGAAVLELGAGQADAAG